MRYRFKNSKQISEVFNDNIWFYIDSRLLKFQIITIVYIFKQVVLCEACCALILRGFMELNIGHLSTHLGNIAMHLMFLKFYI